MPELPEVETTRRGVDPHVVGRKIVALAVHEPRLRWRVPDSLSTAVKGQLVRQTGRRAKYILFQLDSGTLLLHLGMSGSLRVLPADTPRIAHDHFDMLLDSGVTLRFNDPRRFGSLHYTTDRPEAHFLLAKLAPEPLDDAAADDVRLHAATRGLDFRKLRHGARLTLRWAWRTQPNLRRCR